MVYTSGLAILNVDLIFLFFSVSLEWIACFQSGSDNGL
jgi:hypothetical protein